MSLSQAIPIQNIYYLFTYAWECFREGDRAEVSALSCPDCHNLLAAVLCRGIRQLAIRGIDKSYCEVVEETPRLRGRIDVAASYRRLSHLSARMICSFDELTVDTLTNRILRSTCERLRQHRAELSAENQSEIHHAIELLRDVSVVTLSSRMFHQVHIHRNNRQYRFLLNVCRLLFDLYIPEKFSGARRFRDLLESKAMSRIFELFVLRFAKKHCAGANVWPMKIRWAVDRIAPDDKFLPEMRTDVTIEYPERKLILDCKFYPEVFLVRHEREKLRSAHLYQLFAYLQNKAISPDWKDVEGILLYPAVSPDIYIHSSHTILGHQMRIESVDLNRPWPEIHDSLLKVLISDQHVPLPVRRGRNYSEDA
jgi:5-methylcytosine-specific restriction enzyme subunit McrC